MRHFALPAAGLIFALSACASGDNTPSHPNYAATIADLRVARTILDHEVEYTVEREQYRALEAIDHAVLELKTAAIEGGQPLGPQPQLDPALDYGGRLHRARELVDAADHELSFREDAAAARPARDSARHYVAEAHEAIERVMRDREAARS